MLVAALCHAHRLAVILATPPLATCSATNSTIFSRAATPCPPPHTTLGVNSQLSHQYMPYLQARYDHTTRTLSLPILQFRSCGPFIPCRWFQHPSHPHRADIPRRQIPMNSRHAINQNTNSPSSHSPQTTLRRFPPNLPTSQPPNRDWRQPVRYVI